MASKEIGDGEGTAYPADFDTDTNLEKPKRTLARAATPNDMAASVIALETELGTGDPDLNQSPKGEKANIKEFLQVGHNLDGTHKPLSACTITNLSIDGASWPTCHVYLDTQQSVPSQVTRKVKFDTVVFDDQNAFDTTDASITKDSTYYTLTENSFSHMWPATLNKDGDDDLWLIEYTTNVEKADVKRFNSSGVLQETLNTTLDAQTRVYRYDPLDNTIYHTCGRTHWSSTYSRPTAGVVSNQVWDSGTGCPGGTPCESPWSTTAFKYLEETSTANANLHHAGAVDSSGNLRLLHANRNVILVFDTNGDETTREDSFGVEYSYAGVSGVGDYYQDDVVIDANNWGDFVSDANGFAFSTGFGSDDKIYTFNNSGDIVADIDHTGTSAAPGLALSGTKVFALDSNNDKVYVYHRYTGDLITSWGDSGIDFGEFNLLSGIAVDDNYVYIADRGNKKITVFDQDGHPIVESAAMAHEPQKIIALDDRLYVFINKASGSDIIEKWNLPTPEAFTWTPTVAGIYRIIAQVKVLALNAGKYVALSIYKNGIEWSRMEKYNDRTSTRNLTIKIEDIVESDGTDVFDIRIWHNHDTGPIDMCDIDDGSKNSFFMGSRCG